MKPLTITLSLKITVDYEVLLQGYTLNVKRREIDKTVRQFLQHEIGEPCNAGDEFNIPDTDAIGDYLLQEDLISMEDEDA